MICRVTIGRIQSRQHGTVLPTALVFLLLISLIAFASTRSGLMDLRIATNEELRISSFEFAQSVVDATAADPTNTRVIGSVGYRNCTSTLSCDSNDVVLADSYQAARVASGDITVEVERLAPELRPPPRGIESSADKFDTAAFSVNAQVGATDAEMGAAQVEQGVLVLVPKF